jgi:UDP-N-acetylglucosamine 2-epimerase (non-hydrolysing)
MRRCLFVIGTRAQLVKVAPVLQRAHASGLRHIVWFTGQHHESIDDLIADFQLSSDFRFPNKRRERSSIGGLLLWAPKTFYRCWEYVKAVRTWTTRRPLVVVHGDTLSTVLGAVAGKWGGGDVVHLESGLSSGKMFDPFPEELLRRLTFRRTRYALCPNAEAVARMEKYRKCIVVDTGENTLLDCVRSAIEGDESLGGASDGRRFVASIHRFQNIYSRTALATIVDEILDAAEFGTVDFILHPPTEKRLRHYGLYQRLEEHANVELLPRKPYTEFLRMLQGARAVFSDGGSNQEELSYLGVPTVLFRERSERPDGLGRNIVLRNDIDNTMRQFVESGGIDRLRTPSKIDASVEPSRITVEALLKWAGSEAPKKKRRKR